VSFAKALPTLDATAVLRSAYPVSRRSLREFGTGLSNFTGVSIQTPS